MSELIIRRQNKVCEEWEPLYPERDLEIVDYHPYVLTSSGLRFRGPDPRPLEKGNYITFLGSAYTYGPFCESPYPVLIKKTLRIPALNLGYGGVGPGFFNRHKELTELANNGRLVVLQVMSARCEGNSRAISNGNIFLYDKKINKRIRAEELWARLLAGDWQFLEKIQNLLLVLPVLCHINALFRIKRQYLKRLVEETRENWIKEYITLIRQFKVPVVLFWFSKRSRDYQENYRSVKGLLGSFPQLVNREMVNKIATFCDDYAECVSSAGLPKRLSSRFSGKVVYLSSPRSTSTGVGPLWFVHKYLSSFNRYYPSPEMHQKAAETLELSLRRILNAG